MPKDPKAKAGSNLKHQKSMTMTPIFSSFKTQRSFLKACSLCLLVLAVAGCGGGSSGPTEPTVPVTPPPSTEAALTLQSLQGRWVTADNDWVARWLPPMTGQSTAAVWLLSKDGQFLSVLNATVSGSAGVAAKGLRYQLDPATGQASGPVNLDWRGLADLKAAPATLKFAEGPSFTLQDPLKYAALQLNAVGSWVSKVGLTNLNVRIDELGVITGSSLTGCNYVGVLTARTDVNTYEAKLSENCAGAVQQLTGIGVMSLEAKLDQLTIAMVSANSQAGKVLYLQRQ